MEFLTKLFDPLKVGRRPVVLLCLLVLGAQLPVLAEPPKGSGNWRKLESLSDEFDGKGLDANKWHDHNPHWKGRPPALFVRENVRVSNGRLLLTAREQDVADAPDGFHSFTTASVKSKVEVRYGYFEICCRAMPSRVSSAFWFYRATDERWTEIDVFEIAGRGEYARKVHMNAHVFRSPERGERHQAFPDVWEASFDLTKKDHTFGLLWNKESLEWYVDGRLVRKLKNSDWHQALHLTIDSETFPDWFGLPDPENLPATFSIDWVRAWQREAHR